MKKCVCDEKSRCKLEKVSEDICLECIVSLRNEMFIEIVKILQNVQMTFDVACRVHDLLEGYTRAMSMTDNWFKRYQPKAYLRLKKQWEEEVNRRLGYRT